MRYAILTLLLMLGSSLSAQLSGTIEYKEEIKMELSAETMESLKGIDLSDMLPESTSSLKTLNFDGSITTYSNSTKDEEDEETRMESDDGSVRMVFQMSTDESILHTNHKTKEVTEQTSFMGKTFLISREVESLKWKITNEKVKYLDYECTKAIAEGEEDKDGKPKEVVAWFTMQIPASIGPVAYHGLPGAVLMVSINGDKTQIRATSVSLEKPDAKHMEMPTKGKKVTSEEYVKLIKQHAEEMKDQHGGRGGGIFIETRG